MAECCRILGALFYHSPRRDDVQPVLELIASGKMADLWPLGEPAACAAALAEMRTGLASGPDDLATEFQRLLIGPDALDAPPWGSVYLEEEGTLYGESTQALQAFLGGQGVVLATGQEEPEDHVALLFWAVAWLAEARRTAAVATLLEAHLLPWVGIYLTRLQAATTHPFYRGLAQLAEQTVHGMCAALALPSLPKSA